MFSLGDHFELHLFTKKFPILTIGRNQPRELSPGRPQIQIE